MNFRFTENHQHHNYFCVCAKTVHQAWKNKTTNSNNKARSKHTRRQFAAICGDTSVTKCFVCTDKMFVKIFVCAMEICGKTSCKNQAICSCKLLHIFSSHPHTRSDLWLRCVCTDMWPSVFQP